MAKRKQESEVEEAKAVVMGFAHIVDALLVRYTGRTVRELLTESMQRSQELPAGQEISPGVGADDMSLDNAYAVLGLRPGVSLDDVKRSYRNLARAFHSDKGSAMNDEAMKLLNRAYERVTRELK